ncbi:hypothetical protein CD178_02064 [Komagataeibacter saccharivorans]|uniref:Uncharacterized protein n=2 Tax=Komagataeibacter saccharivorans TaxID=265959 RepID=A0A347WD77_9PROT|nr:hypothetical protein [Komagataeibacter saccharivorans]AXY22820.1 hypothetical protein CD178_02064 [Komagataeibacter saccharivorans]
MGTPKIQALTPAPMAGQQVNNSGAQQVASTTNAAKLAGGFGSTLLTGAQGISQTATNAPKTLLGG